MSDEPQNPHWEQHCPNAQPMQLLLLPQVPSVVVLWPGGRTTVGLAVLLLLLLLLVVVVELVETVVDEVVVVTVDVDELLVVVADVVVVIEPSQTPYAGWQPEMLEQYRSEEPQYPHCEQQRLLVHRAPLAAAPHWGEEPWRRTRLKPVEFPPSRTPL